MDKKSMNRAERRRQERENKKNEKVDMSTDAIMELELKKLIKYFNKWVNIFVDGHQWSDMFLRRSNEEKEYRINNKDDRNGFVEIFVYGLLKEYTEMVTARIGTVLVFDGKTSTPLHNLLHKGLKNTGYDMDLLIAEYPIFLLWK